MSTFLFDGYLAQPRELGSYSELSTDFYKTFQPDNWQHNGSSEWSAANMPGWGNNPMLQMFPRVGTDGVGFFNYRTPEEEKSRERKTYFVGIVLGVAAAIVIGKMMGKWK